jgi:sulfane dehydrogenase subunit SoxC
MRDVTLDESVSPPARVAGPDEDVSVAELRLAARNHGMPLEALRYDVTPVGLHYLLTHYDIPAIDPARWRLRIDGHVDRPLMLGLDELRALRPVTLRVTMECAGNGRARLSPHVVSQPWLYEAVGTAEWTGTPLAGLLDEVDVRDDAVELVFTGMDVGREGGTVQPYARSLPVAEATREEVLLAYEMNGRPLLPQHGFPLRLLVPGWYGMASVKWLADIEAVADRFEGYQQAVSYRLRQDADEPGEPLSRIAVRSLLAPPGIPDFITRRRLVGPQVRKPAGAFHGAYEARNKASVDRATSAVEAANPDALQASKGHPALDLARLARRAVSGHVRHPAADPESGELDEVRNRPFTVITDGDVVIAQLGKGRHRSVILLALNDNRSLQAVEEHGILPHQVVDAERHLLPLEYRQ